MARNYLTLTTSAAVALVGGTAKTILQLASAANSLVAVQEVTVTFDGTVAANTPVIVQLVRQTSAGTMTNRTPLKLKDTSTALQSSGQENASAEPTVGDMIRTYHIHPQAGVLYPLSLPDGEVEMAGGTRFAVKVNAVQNVNCLATIIAEE